MADKLFFNCACGKRIAVELFEAGSAKTCPACRAETRVPNSMTLRELSGDKYPLLRPIEKIRQLAANREPPFDGPCQACGARDAAVAIPVTLRGLVERAVEDRAPIRPTLGGVDLVTAGGHVTWKSTTFPLMLCTACLARFARDRSRGAWLNVLKSLAVVGLLIAFLVFAYYHAAAVAALAGVLSLVGAVAWYLSLHQNKKADAYLLRWIQHVRWAPEAVADEEEFELTAGAAQPLPSAAGAPAPLS